MRRVSATPDRVIAATRRSGARGCDNHATADASPPGNTPGRPGPADGRLAQRAPPGPTDARSPTRRCDLAPAVPANGIGATSMSSGRHRCHTDAVACGPPTTTTITLVTPAAPPGICQAGPVRGTGSPPRKPHLCHNYAVPGQGREPTSWASRLRSRASAPQTRASALGRPPLISHSALLHQRNLPYRQDVEDPGPAE
jgi:hypothetical protein